MSLWAVGTIAGALTGGLMYHAFSSSIHTRAATVSQSLHECSTALLSPPPPGPVPAARRIEKTPFTDLLKRKWNEEIEGAWVDALHYDYAGLWSRTRGYVGELAGRARKSVEGGSAE